MRHMVRFAVLLVVLGCAGISLAAAPQLSLYQTGTFGSTNLTSASITAGAATLDLDLVMNSGGSATDGMQFHFTTDAANLNYAVTALTALNTPFTSGDVQNTLSGAVNNSTTVLFKSSGSYAAFNSAILTYHLNPSALAAGTYTITPVGEFMTDGGNTVTTFATPGAFSLTVNPVPEPATLGLVALAGLTLLRRRR